MDSNKVALMLVVLMTVGCVLNVTAHLNVDNYDGIMMESQGSPLRSAYNYDLDVAEHKKKKYRGYSRGYGHGGGGGGGGSSEERR